jgi:phage terminase small subunit
VATTSLHCSIRPFGFEKGCAILVAMPILSNNRRERFCQGIAKGLSATEAYLRAGYTGRGNVAEVSASQILRNLQVKSRLAELAAKAAQKHEITVEKLTNDLLQVRDLAVADKQFAAATGAIALVARMHGLLVDQKHVDIVHHKPAKEAVMKDIELSEDEWLRLYKPSEFRDQ